MAIVKIEDGKEYHVDDPSPLAAFVTDKFLERFPIGSRMSEVVLIKWGVELGFLPKFHKEVYFPDKVEPHETDEYYTEIEPQLKELISLIEDGAELKDVMLLQDQFFNGTYFVLDWKTLEPLTKETREGDTE